MGEEKTGESNHVRDSINLIFGGLAAAGIIAVIHRSIVFNEIVDPSTQIIVRWILVFGFLLMLLAVLFGVIMIPVSMASRRAQSE